MLLHLFVLAALLYGPLWRKPWLTVYRQTNSVCLPVCLPVCLSVRLYAEYANHIMLFYVILYHTFLIV